MRMCEMSSAGSVLKRCVIVDESVCCCVIECVEGDADDADVVFDDEVEER